MTSTPRRDRLAELLADRALVGPLEPADEAELATLSQEGHGLDQASFERAAAAVAIAGVTFEAMPAGLAARVGQDALQALPSQVKRPAHLLSTVPMPDRPIMPSAPPSPPSSYPAQDGRMYPAPNVVALGPRRASRVVVALGWVAAAACLLLAVGAYWIGKRGNGGTVAVATAPSVERDKLLARAGTTRLDWSATKDPASVAASGDVVWNASLQRGFMRFKGLAKNVETPVPGSRGSAEGGTRDAKAFQYQLWIFDKGRDDRYPVDGGVFDVDAEGDVIVPIKTQIPVGEIALFAVTVEKPGGVVVSKRERIVVTAKPAG